MLRNYFQEDEYEVYKSTDNLMFKSLELVCKLFGDNGFPIEVFYESK